MLLFGIEVNKPQIFDVPFYELFNIYIYFYICFRTTLLTMEVKLGAVAKYLQYNFNSKLQLKVFFFIFLLLLLYYS